jgi:uncharacterized membrane protein (DUF373 family)
VQKEPADSSRARTAVIRTFGWVEDVVYVGLGVLLAVTAIALLVQGGAELVRVIGSGVDARAAVLLLDRILLALMIVELLYTVLVSFREHTLVAEPFLLVALIAAIRRILVITAEFGAQARPEETLFRHVMLELALLTVLIGVLVASLVVLKRRGSAEAA